MKLEVKLTARKIDLQDGLLVFDSPEALKKQIQLLQDALNDRVQQLEFFDDGIYFNGELMEIKGRHEAIMRCFETLDRIPVIDLICKVWKDSLTPMSTVCSTINHLNKKLERYRMFIERDGDFFKIIKDF